jgi:hypothetical protein
MKKKIAADWSMDRGPFDLKPAVTRYKRYLERIGLGVPRGSIWTVSRNGKLRLVQPATGLDVTDEMRAACEISTSQN